MVKNKKLIFVCGFTTLLLSSALLYPTQGVVAGPREERYDDEEQRDTLTSLMESKALRTQKNGGKNYPDTQDLKPGSNLRRFFFTIKFPRNAIDWLAPSGSRITWKETQTRYEETHVTVDSLAYDSDTKKDFRVKLLVPHPVYIPMVDSGIVEEFSALQPPMLRVTSSENLLIHDFKASAYIHTTEICSVVFNLAHGALLEIRSVEECGNLSAIRTLIEELDIIRLDQRLQS